MSRNSTGRSQRVCPWWLCFTFDNLLRRLVQDPEKILKPYIKPGWQALDLGPGMGYFTIPLARLVGPTGKVIAADLQKGMLDRLWQRALRAGVQDRVVLHQTSQTDIGIDRPLDFCLAFWMLHEVREPARFLGEIAAGLKPGGLFLLVEPRVHVTPQRFATTLSLAQGASLAVVERPRIWFSRAALLRKN
jgi:ubiquinone/menaquinone biosynthesis C-methylase UbiE